MSEQGDLSIALNGMCSDSRRAEIFEKEYRSVKAQHDELLAVLNEIGGYTGEGRINSPWQEIVKSIGEKARAAIANAEKTP